MPVITCRDETDGGETPRKRTRFLSSVTTRSQTKTKPTRSTLKTKRSLKMKLKTKLKSKKAAKEKAAKAKIKEEQGRPSDKPKGRILNLDQIRKLSDTTLLKKFAEHRIDKVNKKSDKIPAEHMYICKLLPDNCCKVVKGVDRIAKHDMKRHLLAHIGELLTLSATEPANANKLEFTSIEDGSGMVREGESTLKGQNPDPPIQPDSNTSSSEDYEDRTFEPNPDASTYLVPVLQKPVTIELPKSADMQRSSFTVIKSSEGLNEVVLLPKGQFINLTTMADSSDNSNPLAKGILLADKVPNIKKDTVAGSLQRQRYVPNILRRSRRSSQSSPSKKSTSGIESRLTLSEFAQIVTEEAGYSDEIASAAYHDDHNYTIVQKKPQVPELMNTDAEGKPVRPETSSQYIEMDSPPNYYEGGLAADGNAKLNPEQQQQQQQMQMNSLSRAKPTRIKMSEVMRNAKTEVEKSDEDAQSKQVRLKALEILKSMRKRRARLDDGNGKGQFECEICGKLYTAGATLTAHYRSHAGIKPFQCQICKASFTRLHSLNYHMMIHNSQSRFTCEFCSRKFRHPSHFKEHLRRHTGEAPFACCDCPRRFKTRNTYKRHLRSKHGKVLTAKGITTMEGVPVAMPVTVPALPIVTSIKSEVVVYDEEEEEEDNDDEEKEQGDEFVELEVVGEDNEQGERDEGHVIETMGSHLQKIEEHNEEIAESVCT
uniref:Zinc finger protein 131-like n=1 Tax=Saccoglossus kowalevskii TaxID=10224 RepID=A0ABM0MJQ1_SACKO|nr:PREDICTED: zinc finger protein 131-like [Saccoglossus kowalevskii]